MIVLTMFGVMSVIADGCGEYEKCEFYSKCDVTQNACACPTCVDVSMIVCNSLCFYNNVLYHL